MKKPKYGMGTHPWMTHMLSSPMVEWQAMTERVWFATHHGKPGVSLRQAQDELDGLLEKAARLRGYLAAREEGKPHAKAVDASNRLATKVRRALGRQPSKVVF
jgi:hypothetical protein